MLEDVEYSPKTKKALSNYFDGLAEPVSLFIGTYDLNSSLAKETSRDGDNSLILKTVEVLRKNGIDAVPFFDESAKSPDKVVVSKTGLQTPFVAPENAKAETANLLNILENNGIESLGFVTPNTEKQLLYPATNDDIMNENKVIDIEKANPDPEKFQQIMKEKGPSFINEMLDTALNSPDLKDLGNGKALEMDIQNRLNGCKTLYKGATQGANVFAVISPYEARNVPHASPKLVIAKSYSGLGNNASSKGGATYIDKESERSYGFVYEIEARDDQKYYANIGLETADAELQNSENFFETPIMPHRNKVKAIYLHCGSKEDGFLFKIPENDARWQDFMALHEPSDNTIFGYLAERRKQQKDDAKTAGHTVAYELNKNQELDTPNYHDLSEVKIVDFLKSISKKVDITEDENGRLIIKGNVDLSRLDIETLPKDFAKIKIEGSLNLNGNEKLEISSLDQLPETTKGVTSFAGTKFNFGDLSQRSSEEMVAKICGTDTLKKDTDGFYPELNFHGKIDKLPNDFKDLKAEGINFHDPVEFATLDDLPETHSGVLRGLNIKDQSFDVSPHYFLRKTRGTRYADNFGINNDARADDFVPERVSFMNFANSNIHNFPKGMENVTFDALELNPNYTFESLDNFPKTLRGVSGLNLTGVSEQETAKSFLEKVWGMEYLANDAHIAQNGNIIIHNSLDLGKNRTTNIEPEAIPYDFATVKIGDSFTLDAHLNGSYRVAADRRPLEKFLKKDRLIDLSGYKDKIVLNRDDLKQAEQVIMPKEIDSIALHDNTLPPITLDCSGAKNLKITDYCNLSDANLIMPEKADQIAISDSTLSRGDVAIKNVRNLELSQISLGETNLIISKSQHISLNNLRLNDNCTLDCRESASLQFHNCNLAEVKDLKLPDSPGSNINFYQTKLPKGEYDFAKYEKPIGLNAVEFTSDSKLVLPRAELAPAKYFGGYKMKFPEAYAYGVNYPGVKFPEMEWNLFELKANKPDEKDILKFQQQKEYYEKTAFADKNIDFMNADLSLVKNFKLPQKMSVLRLDAATLPKCSLDLSGASLLEISRTNFNKCDEIKFPEELNKLDIHQNKFKDGAKLDISGVKKLSIHAQDFSNVSELKINPKGEITISSSNLPQGIDMDLSQCKSVQIRESDLSECGTLRLPEGYSMQNIIKSKLPENVFIGKERYIAPKEEKIEEMVNIEKTVSVEKVVTETYQPEPSTLLAAEHKEKTEPTTYKLSKIQDELKYYAQKFHDPEGIIIDDRKRIKNKELEKLGLSKQQRRSIVMNRRKENLEKLFVKIKSIANNSLTRKVLGLRGIDVQPKNHKNEESKANIIDFTEKRELETFSAVNSAKAKSLIGKPSAESGETKISKSVKRAINILRGIIPAKKNQVSANNGNIPENIMDQARLNNKTR